MIWYDMAWYGMIWYDMTHTHIYMRDASKTMVSYPLWVSLDTHTHSSKSGLWRCYRRSLQVPSTAKTRGRRSRGVGRGGGRLTRGTNLGSDLRENYGKPIGFDWDMAMICLLSLLAVSNLMFHLPFASFRWWVHQGASIIISRLLNPSSAISHVSIS